MKILRWAGWISAVFGVIALKIGIISQLFRFNPFHIIHNYSYLMVANSFLLLALVLFIGSKKCCENCCKDDKTKA
jgi:hypothetical protein